MAKKTKTTGLLTTKNLRESMRNAERGQERGQRPRRDASPGGSGRTGGNDMQYHWGARRRRHSVIIAGTGFIVSGTFDQVDPRSFMSDRIANNEAFPQERLLRLPRRWDRTRAFDWYLRNRPL